MEKQKVLIIAAADYARQSEEMVRFLTSSHFSLEKTFSPKKICLVDNVNALPRSCAIVFVSDEATRDSEWQRNVRAVPENYRLIPVGKIEKADFNNEKVVPQKLEQINFIQSDSYYRKNIWISMTTDPDFYEINNRLTMRYNAWLVSAKSELQLMTDLKDIQNCLIAVEKRICSEEDVLFQKHLEHIKDYLTLSKNYAKKLQSKRKRRNISTVFVTLTAVLTITILAITVSLLSTAKKDALYLSLQSDADNSPETALNMLNGFANPLTSKEAKREYCALLGECLNYNWSSAVISGSDSYRWTLNDAELCKNPRFLWTVSTEGCLLQWDTHTGKILKKYPVSGQPPLNCLGVNVQENLFIVFDFNNNAYVSKDLKQWRKTDLSDNISYAGFEDTQIVINNSSDYFASFSHTKIDLFSLGESPEHLRSIEADTIYDVEIGEDAVTAVVADDGAYYLLVFWKDPAKDLVIRLDYRLCDFRCVSIHNDKVAFFDADGNLICLDRQKNYSATSLGLKISRPVDLCFLNDDTLVFTDRNTGTHLYDISLMLEIGEILPNIQINELEVRNNIVLGKSFSCFTTADVSAMLPQRSLKTSQLQCLSPKKAQTSNGLIRKLSLYDGKTLRLDLDKKTAVDPLIFDTGCRLFMSDSQTDKKPLTDITDYRLVKEQPFYIVGNFSTCALLEKGDVFLVSGTDGSFYEVALSSDLSTLVCSSQKIPSHLPIIGIYTDGKNYYLEDTVGTLWFAHSAKEIRTLDGACRLVKEHLRCPISASYVQDISKKVLRKVNPTLKNSQEEEQ